MFHFQPRITSKFRNGEYTQNDKLNSSPSNPRENRRISDCGLRVRDGRIQGNLAVARAFGDFQYKKNEEKGQLEQAVSCLPDVHCFQRSVKVVYLLHWGQNLNLRLLSIRTSIL